MRTSNSTPLFLFQVMILKHSSSAAFLETRSKSWTAKTHIELQSYAPCRQEYESNYLFDDFRTAGGEIVNPYEILSVNRNANIMDIKQNYRKLSKLYHPDSVRFADSLPKNCYTSIDVRNEWEKISLAYTVLSDKKQRLKYDRHSAIDEFGSAMVWGITGLQKGLSSSVKKIARSVNEGRRLSQKIDHSLSEITVQLRSMEVEAKAKTKTKTKAKAKTKTDPQPSSSSKKDGLEIMESNSCAVNYSSPEKLAVVPPPVGQYYTPFEACSIIHEHELNPSLNKPEAMKIMFDNKFVPVKRAQLYLLLNRYKEGELTSANEWGRVGRPQLVKS